MCASPGAAQVVVEGRPVDKTLVCVSLLRKRQSCKQFGEDEDDVGRSRGGVLGKMWRKNALRKGAGLRGGRAGAPCRWLAVTDFHPEHNKAFQTVKVIESKVHKSVSKAKNS